MPLTINKPTMAEYPAVYQPYMDHLPDDDVLYSLDKQAAALKHMFRNISDERAEETYAAGKWTIKELLQHMLDSERIFAYRALCISRGEAFSLPGYDENLYAANSLANIRPLAKIMEEYELIRNADLAMFRSFTSEMLDRYGVANGNRVSLRGLLHVMAAHELHHINILESRYLKRKA